jgi:hypothetical protein
MSARTDSLLFDFVDPLKAALDLVKSERLNTEVTRVLNPSLSRKKIKNFQRSMWEHDQVSRLIGQYLELAAALPPPAMIYVETADGERVGFAGERLLDDARLVGMPGNLVLCIDGGNYTVVAVSGAPANAGSSPVPGMVVNPDFVRWREMTITWQQERVKRQQQFLAACEMIRRDAYEVDIEADNTVAAYEQAEPIDDRANGPGMNGGSSLPTIVASYLAEGKKIGGHMRVHAPYLAWLREQSQPLSYDDRLEKLKALALAAGWPTPDGPVRSTLREWEKKLRQEFLQETNQPDRRPLSA